MTSHFDVAIVGSGFGSSFFLYKALQRLPSTARILVLERGSANSHAWQIASQRNSEIDSATTIRVPAGHKPWQFTIGLGGGTNCWFGATPRMHPNDFALRTRYGVGADWPLSYADLEPYYSDAEAIMQVAGDDANHAVFPRSRPYPQPHHRLTTADNMMKAAMPELHFGAPSARATVPTPGRGVCCNGATCSLCPSNAKFTASNGFAAQYSDPRVTVKTNADVTALEAQNGSVRRVHYTERAKDMSATADLFVLGANAIFSPSILQRSGLATPLCGKGLHEQLGAQVEVFLDGVDHFDGGTINTGMNYALLDGPHRREAAGVTVVFRNFHAHGLRMEYGRWRQTLPLLLVAESLPSDDNGVRFEEGDARPLVTHARRSAYAEAGVDRAMRLLPQLLSPLPVERIEFRGYRDNEAHVQGTVRMGTDPATSVVDAGQVHHRLRNLVVVGTSVFPSCSTANPSLTAAALSLRAASRLW